jgi:FkbM family methyltransferase
MIIELPCFLRFVARHFAGTRKFFAEKYISDAVKACRFEHITFHFEPTVMDGKRLIALAVGAIEAEEIALARKYLTAEDVVVEFGSGLGIAAARVHRAINPKAHFCFEANPVAVAYSRHLFTINEMQIDVDQRALGNGSTSHFYAANDYILSSFDIPKNTKHFKKIDIPTISLSAVIKEKNPTAVFCDIEGAEDEFLPPEDLQGVDKVIIELHPGHYGMHGVQRIKDKFTKNGFVSVEQQQDTHCFLRR